MSSLNLDEKTTNLIEREIDEFHGLLASKGDLIPMMLRTHLATENLLERFIIAYLPGGCALIENANLTYNHKLEIVNSFQVVDSKVIGALRQLNKVRNSASHSKDATVNHAELERIGRPLGSTYINIRKQHHSNLEAFTLNILSQLFANLLGVTLRIELSYVNIDSDKSK